MAKKPLEEFRSEYLMTFAPTKNVYSNCYTCGKELVEGQEITTVHQFFYCDKDCLEKDIQKIKLGNQ